VPTFVAGSGTGDNYGNILLPIIDVQWFKSALFGALFELTKSENWIEMGDIGVSFAIEEAAQMIDGYTFMNFNPFPIGLILPYGGDEPPPAYFWCDGNSVVKADYPELYAVIGGNFFEEDDVFYLPDLRSATVIGKSGDYPIGTYLGTETVTLDESQIPSHTHTIPLTTTTLAFEPGEVTVTTPIPFFTDNTGSTGGGEPHNNFQPSLSCNYIIYAGRV